MKKTFILLLLVFNGLFAQKNEAQQASVINSDIDNFWFVYETINATEDRSEQNQILQELFIDKGSPGLFAIIEARDYTKSEYLDYILNYPKFWNSIRKNTLKSADFTKDLNKGIDKLRAIYPELKPAQIYFTIGAFRTGGTTLDGMVLIGSELAMGDQNTDTSEFPEEVQKARRTYYDSNPIDDIVLLNVHEYVHTQQNPLVHNLLSQCLYEGVAEFVSVTAMDQPSSAPAVQFGKDNSTAVFKKFEEEIFKMNNTSDWLWSLPENDFNIRDLGYYIGYEICERNYNMAKDKKQAIKEMIELDFTNEAQIEKFVDGTKVLSKPLEDLYQDFQAKRPTVQNVKIDADKNENGEISPGSNVKVSLDFSTVMHTKSTNFELGPLGLDVLLRVKNVIGFSNDAKTFNFEVDLEADKHYQLTVGGGFRTPDGIRLIPYLIEFRTAKE